MYFWMDGMGLLMRWLVAKRAPREPALGRALLGASRSSFVRARGTGILANNLPCFARFLVDELPPELSIHELQPVETHEPAPERITSGVVEWEKVHVFISSTFNDMHAERDYLVKYVFPELSEWCEARKLRLVDIDLRWGVTEQDATQNKNVVKVCLDRIDDCRPFFLCFLGQRRGWEPELDDISQETFDEYTGLKKYAGKDSVTEMEIRHALFEPLHAGKRSPEKPEDRYYRKVDHAFFYLRDDSYLKQLPADPPELKEIYTNDGIEDEAERAHANQQLDHWRDIEIRKKSGRPVCKYQASWDPKSTSPELLMPLQCPSTEEKSIKWWRKRWAKVGVEVSGLDVSENANQADIAHNFNQRLVQGRLGDFRAKDKPLSEVIIQDLIEAIKTRFPNHAQVSEKTDLQKEIDQQEQFLFISSEGFISRENDFDELNN